MTFGKKKPDHRASSDRRAAARMPTGVQAKAIFADTSKDCSVVDFTNKGARLQLQGFTALPDKFELYVPDRQASLRATVQWRVADEVGVLFDGPRAGASQDLGLHSAVEKLEARIARLEAIVASLSAPRVTSAD